jgi:hypothetical protein
VSRPVVGENVNGALQRSVRFRVEPGKDFRVRLRAVGPGGSEEFERTFRAPRARADADVERVVRAIERANASPVFAVGDPAVLTGRSASCDIPTSLRGGTLEVTGCLQPIESLADIPAAERGILDPLAMELGLDRARAELMRTAVEMTDGFKTQAQLALNDKWPVVPGPGASILALPQAKALTSSDAGFDVGGFRIKQPDDSSSPWTRARRPRGSTSARCRGRRRCPASAASSSSATSRSTSSGARRGSRRTSSCRASSRRPGSRSRTRSSSVPRRTA